MSIYAIIPAAALVVNTILAIYILSRGPNRIENKIFAVMLFFFSLWDIGEILMRTASNSDFALLGARVYLTGGFLCGPAYFVFTLFFPKKNRLSSNKLLIGLIVVISTVIMSLNWFTTLIFVSTKSFYWGYSPIYGPFYPLAAFVFLAFTGAGLAVMGLTYRKTEIIMVRKRVKFVIIGTMIPIILGSPSNVIYPLLGISDIELASVFIVVMGGFIAYAILRYKVLIIPVSEETRSKEAKLNLNRGVSYLIEEEKPETSFGIFINLVSHGAHGLCVSRMPPESVREEYGLQKTPIIWLSRTVYEKMCIDPAMTGELSMAIKDFIEESENGVVILDGLEYLIVHNNFNKILKLIHDINESIAVHRAVLLLPVDRRILNEKEFALLERDIKKLPLESAYELIPKIGSKEERDWVTV